MSEFDLISRYFANATASRSDVALAIGDDCALLEVPEGMQLAVSMDTLVCGRHFVPDVDPKSLGHKALAVNLSDLAAMGASPAWVMLALTLPDQEEAWVEQFMLGFSALAAEHNVQLVGGDTTRGHLSISLQAHGFVPKDKALRRDAAQVGDLIYVSGERLGDAGLALLVQQGRYNEASDLDGLQRQLDWPQPRLELGQALLEYATAAIDISDGLGADLRHICDESGVGASLYAGHIPMSAAMKHYIKAGGDENLPLSAGDDYELVFTIPLDDQIRFETAMHEQGHKVTMIGVIESGNSITVISHDGLSSSEAVSGYDHFKD